MMRTLFLVLSMVTAFERNYVAATDSSNNQIENLLETLIQKIDVLEKNMEKQIDDVNTVVSTIAFRVDDLVTDVDNVKRDVSKGRILNTQLFKHFNLMLPFHFGI